MSSEEKREFPFQAVFDAVAEPILEKGLGKETFKPFLAMVNTDWKSVLEVRILPSFMVDDFFASPGGKEGLGRLIRLAVDQIGEDPYAMVLVSEAYFKETKKPSAEAIKHLRHSSLEHDVEAKECIFISIYRRGCTRLGYLEIGEGRTLTNKGLHFLGDMVAGRLSTNPDLDLYQEQNKKAH